MTSAVYIPSGDAPIDLAFEHALNQLRRIARERSRHWKKGLMTAEAYLDSLFHGDLRFAERKLDPNYKRLTRTLFAVACETFNLNDMGALPGQRRPWYPDVAKNVVSTRGNGRKAYSRRGWRY